MSTSKVNATAWSNGLEVTGGGTGIVSHAGPGLLRRLADKTELTGLSHALWSGRVLADISCVIADGRGRSVISGRCEDEAAQTAPAGSRLKDLIHRYRQLLARGR